MSKLLSAMILISIESSFRSNVNHSATHLWTLRLAFASNDGAGLFSTGRLIRSAQ